MTSSELTPLHPPIEPYASGHLDVGDGHHLYWEECGNPDGKPAVFVHGGPGGGCSATHRRFFDPERYRIVLLDQRNCGRSRPHASEPDADLATNTTPHLVADLERLRTDRGIDSWLVFGGSWGSALALAYAQAHPDRVSELVLRGIFTLRRSELDWYYNGPAGQLAPEWRERFLAPLGWQDPTGGDAIAAYHDLLFDPDPAVHGPAGVAWTTWEAATTTLAFDAAQVEAYAEPSYALAFARIENHYFVNGGWLEEGQLLAGVDAIRHIPAVIVQGAYDLACPPVTAWELHRAWPEASFHLVLAGHSAMEPAIADRLVRATDAFADPEPRRNMTDTVDVTDNPEKRRFEARLDGELAGFAEYQLTDELIVFTHTEVDPAFEGRGIGGALARHALDAVRAAGTRRVLPICPFIKGWIGKHPDYVELLYGAPASTARD